MPRALNKPRNARIMELYDEGTTWQAIAEALEEEGFGKVTRQNVGQIIHAELDELERTGKRRGEK